MHSKSILTRSVLLFGSGALLFVLAGCPKQENFPTQLELVESPVPETFVITSLGDIEPDGDYDYDLSWTVSDASNVDRYRLYLVGAGFEPELVEETTQTALAISLPSDGVGLQFGLSTVSTGSVESAMKIATIPAAPDSLTLSPADR